MEICLKNMKNIFDIATFPIVSIITILGFNKSLYEFRNSTKEKAKENRLKQLSTARDILDKMFSEVKSKNAMKMLDWDGRAYQDNTFSHFITLDNVRLSMRVDNLAFNEKEQFIRDCFEDFFDKLELIAHYINIGLINEEDVSVPLSYYAKIIMHDYDSFKPFLLTYGYEKANSLIITISKE
ncbi:MAG: hypothetical protein WA010_03680 [Sulfuricurvum sp.]